MIAYCRLLMTRKREHVTHIPPVGLVHYILTPHATPNALVVESVNFHCLYILFNLISLNPRPSPKAERRFGVLRNIICCTGETYILSNTSGGWVGGEG